MLETSYRVVLEGSVLPGHTEQDVAQVLCALFRRSPAEAGQLLDGTPRIVARGLRQEKAEQYCGVLLRAGLAGRVERDTSTH